MSNELAKRGPAGITPSGFEEAKAMAATLCKARGFVPDHLAGEPAMVLAAIMTGAELGIGPMEAMRSIHSIKGKQQLDATLMLKLMILGGVRHQWLEQSTTVARLRLTREGWEPHEHVFTIEDAKRAQLLNQRGQMWEKYPAAMLRSRCLSAAMRAYCPDTIGAGVYVEGELGEPEPQPPAARLVTPESEPASVEEQPEEVEGETVDEPETKAPAKLPDCTTEMGLRRWCAAHADAVIEAHGEKARRAILRQGEAIGVLDSVVDGWLPEVAA